MLFILFCFVFVFKSIKSGTSRRLLNHVLCHLHSYTLAEFKYSVMNSKCFSNVFHNSQKRFHTFPGPDANNRGYQSFFKLNNSICIFKKKNIGFFCKSICHCWVWRLIDSLYYFTWKVPRRCENFFLTEYCITKGFQI